ncbi:MAG: imidazole glycerol phosphate synthase subunit HisF [Candidatus Yanofskybacteria bacterium]|nr:imidazole glycerol phosphate synthase subunit HisF [Candidatus Yanofskybacteria bacterium]
MKKVRIIPRLDIKGPNVVKGIHCEGLRVVGNPKDLAYRYYRDGADEILFMDIVASLYQRNFDFNILRSISERIFIPITVGGGIRSINDINNALRSGADKVAINTYAIKHPEFLGTAARKFGSQCIVLSIEAKRTPSGWWEAYTDGGREHTGINAIEWARRAIKLGIGEILVTSIDNDGTRDGFDNQLIRSISSFSPVPVVIHGGAGSKNSFLNACQTHLPEGLSAASVFHYKELSIKDLKKYLYKNNIPVRI